MRFWVLLTVAMGLLHGPLDAQNSTATGTTPDSVLVTGRVVDLTTGRALSLASVVLAEPGPEGRVVWQGSTRSNGEFAAPSVRPGEYDILVTLLAYGDVSHRVDLSQWTTVDIRVEMAPAALELEPIVVTARRRTRMDASGFYDRMESGLGYMMTREDIEERNPYRVSDLFRMIPGAFVYPARLGRAQVHLRGNCVPELVLDGVAVRGGAAIDDLLGVDHLEALEVYHGLTAPAQYSAGSCGTIMAWTREIDGGSPFSIKRLLVAVGLGGAAYLLTR